MLWSDNNEYTVSTVKLKVNIIKNKPRRGLIIVGEFIVKNLILVEDLLQFIFYPISSKNSNKYLFS